MPHTFEVPMLRALVPLALAATLASAGPQVWKKHVVAGSWSFHYPAGWKVKEQESTLELSSPSGQEQLLILALPFDRRRNAQEMGMQMVALLRPSMPDLEATGVQESGPGSASFQCTYTEAGKRFRSEVLVVKEDAAAHWFSYSAPAAGYDQPHGLELLKGLIGSIAPGNASQPPKPTGTVPQDLERNARAFLFVLEFTLGAPLSHVQERLILDELLAGWRRESPEALQKYDLYPRVVTAILGGKQHELEQLRAKLEVSTREWLEESDPSDQVVKVVKTQLEAKSRILSSGNPPLTEMAATAYSEMTAYASLLADDRKADLASLQPARIEAQRQRLRNSWSTLAASDREDVLSTPGLWITFRTLLQYGSAEERARTLAQLVRLNPAAGVPAAGALVSPPRPLGMIEHTVLMNVNQMTFNSYLWSRGFKSTRMGY
jgi:hypothetical protein